MTAKNRYTLLGLLLLGLLAFVRSAPATAEEKPPGPPPALVVVTAITSGEVEPLQEFVGTVYFSRVSRVAAEVAGLVERVAFTEGDTVEAGRPMVTLGADLLAATIDSTTAAYGQAQVELEQAGKALQRVDPLYKEKSVSEKVYDEYYYQVKTLEKRVASLQAAVAGLLLEKDKKTIKAPFRGMIIEKKVEQGEWVAAGGTIAVLADNSEIDVVVDLPASLLQYLKKGRPYTVYSNGATLAGAFISFIPRGDVATRTFSVKLRLSNTSGLVEGMEARVLLPFTGLTSGLLVPRDAVVDNFGRKVIFLAENDAAKMVPVQITGYDGLLTGITGPDLAAGQQVVVKGNERLRDGQPLRLGQ